MGQKILNDWRPYNYIVHISKRISQAIAKGGGRIIVEVPPRHGKSTLISTILPVWFLEWFPEKRVILASYEADFAARWGRAVRNIFENSKILETKIASDSNAADRWNTTLDGGMTTSGIGGSLTGKGGDLIIIDDPIKNWQEAMSGRKRESLKSWYQTTLATRAEPNATIVVLQTRWHQDDLAGWLQREYKDRWEVIRLPAIAEESDPLGRALGEALCPERYNLQDLEQTKIEVGSRSFAALYQQRPTEQEGGIIKRAWLKFWKQLDLSTLEDFSSFWDLTFKGGVGNDYVVGQIWARKGSDRFLIDQVRGQWDAPQTIQAILNLSSRWPQALAKVVEDKANGPAILAMLRDKIPGLIPYNPNASKEVRLNSIAPLFEAGNVYLPDPALYPWVLDYIEEIVSFPNGAHDDQTDTTSMALDRMNEIKTPKIWVL